MTPELLEALQLSRFVAIDLETTGLDYRREEIIEFGAVRFDYGEPAEGISFLIKPGRAIPEYITRLTGITNSMVKSAPPFSGVLPQVKAFLGDLPLVAHNVGFDMPFLEYHARKSESDLSGWERRPGPYTCFSNLQFDTVPLARLFLHFLPSFSLDGLVEFFEIEREEGHRARPDAQAAGQLFVELIKIALGAKFADVQQLLKILEPTDSPAKPFLANLAKVLAGGHYQISQGIDRRKFYMNANHFNIIGEAETFAESENEKSLNPVDLAEVESFFREGGLLASQYKAFEARQPQIDMAKAIAEAFNNGNFLVVEAGTGTGKSLAYLTPSILWAVRNHGPAGRVVVSTNTKNLQEQLFFKDLPILHNVLPFKFKAVLLKGKSNYLCLDKWITLNHDMDLRLNPSERERLLPLYFWIKETQTGDISENNGFRVERNYDLWSKMIAENNYCPGQKCKYYNDCYLMRARNQAKTAHLVLVNHSLLFSDLAAENAVLSEYKNLILDEANNIEKTATEYLGVESTLWQFRDFLRKLYARDRRETGILVQFANRVEKSSLKESHKNALFQMIGEMQEQIQVAQKSVQQFFRQLTSHLRGIAPSGNNNYSSKHRYTRAAGLFAPLEEDQKEVFSKLKRLILQLKEMLEYFKELPAESFEYQRQIEQDLNAQTRQAVDIVNNLEFLLTAEWEHYVYWYELPSRSDSDDTRLYAAPLDVGEILNEKLYGRLRTAVFTSATIAVDQSFNYFTGRVGLDKIDPERHSALLLDSPFVHNEQVLLAVPRFFVEPNHPQYQRELRRFIERLAVEFRRGTMALFTSYSLLNNIYDGISDFFRAEQIPLLAQGKDGSRHSILSRFKEKDGSFLLGTDSFWEGVDLPGKTLEILVITRLPFDVPSEPIIQARSEQIKNRGGNPFMEYSIPEAVIRLRQGFGRLIRSQSDYGAVLILDTRVATKRYGSIFLSSLPVQPRLFGKEEELWQSLHRWFG